MITWMQRHKKYLVVTIWISVIAFVGAGFVGWGAYDFNSDRASAIAKVENRKITVQEYQLAYANYYNFYNNMLGGGLTQEKADQMGLEKIVLESIINETLILAYADEIGLRVMDSEIKQALASDTAFQKNGVFDKETYYRVIKQSQIKPKDYEIGLGKKLLLAKVQNVLKLKPTKAEEELFTSSMFMKDRVAIDIITLDEGEAVVSEDEIKKYWDKHKTEYLTEKSYDLSTIEVALTQKELDEEKLKAFYQEKRHNYKAADGKILSFADARVDVEKDYRLKLSKREALETYLLFKKSQMNATGEKNVKLSDTEFPVEQLKKAKIGTVLKPIETKNGYIIVKIIGIKNPEPKPYQEAKAQILAKLQAEKKVSALAKKAEARLGIFNGRDIGFISRDSAKVINGLTQAESLEFINFVFDNNKLVNYKIIGNKAVLYKILEQDLLSNVKAEKYATLVNDSIKQMKQAEINKNLVLNLKKRYDVEQFYKGK